MKITDKIRLDWLEARLREGSSFYFGGIKDPGGKRSIRKTIDGKLRADRRSRKEAKRRG